MQIVFAYRSKFALALVVCAIALTMGCGPKTASKAKSPAPSKVEMVPHETELTTITLTPEAEQRLGITTVETSKRSVQQHRTLGGEVQVPSGRSISVTAPVAGIVKSIGESGLPSPGSKIKAGDIVLELTPILSPERDVPTPAEQVQMAGVKATLVAAQVTAMGDIQRGKADVVATKITLDRAKKLLSDRAGSVRAVDDAQALAQVATAVLAAAEERHSQLTRLIESLVGTTQQQPATDITIRAPVEGVIRSLNISHGQQVVGGATLFEVLDTSKVWVRVPVFVDLLDEIQPGAAAKVVALGKKNIPHSSTSFQSDSIPAIAIQAPPTADPTSSSADLYFEVANQTVQLRPGQRVGIELPMGHEIDATIVPAASILYDIYGGAWVYTVIASHRYMRQRVTVEWFDETLAILQKGPAPGTFVVADGAAELFGTEFGPGK